MNQESTAQESLSAAKKRLIRKNWWRWIDWGRAYLARRIQPPVRYEDIDYDMTLRGWMNYHYFDVALHNMSWMGVRLLKNPTDMWIYQELIWKVKPDVIVEIGSFHGGSTLFLAHMLDLIGHGEVVSVDISRHAWEVSHPRISTVTGNSNAPEIVAQVAEKVAGRHTMVIHDGDHEAATVLRDLEAYAPLVTVGSYLIVEDGTSDILKTEIGMKPLVGPLYAIEQFLARSPHFVVDRSCERYFVTFNPSGYLKRIV